MNGRMARSWLPTFTGMSKNNPRKRRKMWEKNPRCFWCGRITKWYDRPNPSIYQSHKDEATLDHLRPRHDPTRRERCKPGEVRIVLACWECNNLRDKPEREARGAHITTRPLSEKSDDEVLDAFVHMTAMLAKDPSHPRRKQLEKRLAEYIIPELQRRKKA